MAFGSTRDLRPVGTVMFVNCPYPILETDVAPTWNPEAFFNTMVVNGRTWPRLNVEPRKYRLRLLNGCNSRFINLSMFEVLIV